MDNSIAAILEMDKKAREVSDAAAKKAETLLADTAAKRSRLAKESEDKLISETDAQKAKLREASDREIARAEKAADEKCRALDEKMSAGREVWKKEILSRILGK